MSIIHHLTVFCLLPGCHLWRHRTVFAVFHHRRKEPHSYCRCFGPTLTASVQHAHNTPLRITYNNYLQLSNGLTTRAKRGRSSTPPTPLELGSGAQVISQIHKENITMCISALKVNRGPGLSADIIPPWAGTDAADRPSASAPDRKTVLRMMRQILPRFPSKCPQVKKVGALPQ